MPPQVRVVEGPDVGRAFPLTPGRVLLLGRGQASNTMLVDPAVSRVHCEICWDGLRATVTDYKSASGTYVNGRQVENQELRVGDVVKIGNTELCFENDVAEEKTLVPSSPPRPTTASPLPTIPVAKATKATTPAATSLPEQPKEIVFARKIGGRPVSQPFQQLHELVGKTIGNYQLLNVAGSGQIGLVFKARDAKDDKIVALKVLRPDFLKDTKGMQRFVRGMKAARSFCHPHLIAIVNAGITNPYCWIAMEFIEGGSLADLLQKLGTGGKLDWPRALRVAVHVARALAFMHGQGVIHRNILPANILIQKSDQTAKLGDAMLAKSLQGIEGQEVTASGELVGNMYYMAPERTMNGEIDGRADLYSLGATLYHMVTGQLPFAADSMIELVGKIRQAAPEKPIKYQPALPEALEVIMLKLLAKRPGERFANAGELLAGLGPLAKTQAIS